MRITLGNYCADFRPWAPEHGRVFVGAFAFDSETTQIDRERPWITPSYVLGAAYDGNTGAFVRREHVAAFFAAHASVPVVMHRAPFDMAVIHSLAPELNIFRWVDQHLAWDTQLLHRLFVLGVEGHTASGKGQSTLDHCAEYYLGIQLPKDVPDSKGNPVRLSYGQWLGQLPQEIEPIYLEYLAKDAVVTLEVFRQQWALLAQLLGDAAGTWGYVSPTWLQEQVNRWGWQTHHIQLKAAIVLGFIGANGLTVDLENRDELVERLQQLADGQRVFLRQHG